MNSKRRIPLLNFIILSMAYLPWTGHTQSIPLKVNRLQEEIPVADITSVGGFVGDRILKNKDNYLKTFPIDEHVAFIEARTYKDWDWRKAEQPGKWLNRLSLRLCVLRTPTGCQGTYHVRPPH